MNIEEFIDFIITEYESGKSKESEKAFQENNDFIREEQLNKFWKNVMALFSEKMIKEKVSRKNAARILYAFYKDVYNESDIDWGSSKKLKDIYECRVCANAIAQMYDNGILESATKEYFGLNDILSSDELMKSALKLLKHDFLQAKEEITIRNL
ncbi:hypothetical protein [Butyrivibrio sp. WCE2006]|uniref:hypothetical protein n=1 Tax=Butyrivibrio sp. WCE2006 TaxID=1410611 RepID=UPI0005D22EBB|nr:hypothetical protein [Butyrivibrio sp. WCE2006]